MRTLKLCLATAALLLAAAMPGLACAVPVFRYALERWPPSPYALVVFHRGPLTGADAELVETLRKHLDSESNLLNLILRTVDLDGNLSAEQKRLWERQENPTLPWAALQFPDSYPEEPPAWAGRLDVAFVKGLLDSPLRRELAKRILAGDSIVWILVDSGDKEKDAAALALLSKVNAESQRTLKLPTPEELADDAEVRGQPLSQLPLKLRISLLRIAPGDAAEAALAAILRNSNPKWPANLPGAFVVFGRARAAGPFYAENLVADEIAASNEILAGPCSCQFKQESPGFDLPLAADWDALLEERLVRAPETPNLAVLLPALETSGTPAALPAVGLGPAPARRQAAQATTGLMPAAVLGVMIVLAAVVAVITVILLRRTRNERN